MEVVFLQQEGGGNCILKACNHGRRLQRFLRIGSVRHVEVGTFLDVETKSPQHEPIVTSVGLPKIENIMTPKREKRGQMRTNLPQAGLCKPFSFFVWIISSQALHREGLFYFVEQHGTIFVRCSYI